MSKNTANADRDKKESQKFKILIADGSKVYRRIFMEAIKALNINAFVDISASEAEVIDRISISYYDIIILDEEISISNMHNLLYNIQIRVPDAVILLTAKPSFKTDALFADFLAPGAVNFWVKPVDLSYGKNISEAKDKIKELTEEFRKKSKSKVYNKNKAIVTELNLPLKSLLKPEAVLIAASTGGPTALERVLSDLNPKLPVPVLIAQHMPSHIDTTLAEHLDKVSKLKVKTAENGEEIKPSTVYLAPGGAHMSITLDSRVSLNYHLVDKRPRPSADILFESASKVFEGTVLAVVLTGMGEDGAKGLKALKSKRKLYCIAQDESTSVAYGMPKAAAVYGFADVILPIDEIGAEILSFYDL